MINNNPIRFKQISLIILWINFILLTSVACTSVPEYKVIREDDIPTKITVVDENGDGIKGVDVWRVANPSPKWNKTFMMEKTRQISLSYLKRIASRYKDVAEFATPPGLFSPLENRLTPGFSVLDVTDKYGETGEIIKYNRYESERPDAVTVQYIALNYGYIPSIVQVNVYKGSTPTPLRITLHRNTEIELPTASYWMKFIDIRTKFRRERRFSHDAEKARKELLALALKAEEAGNYIIAARIYCWIPYLPITKSINNSGGEAQISGYKREFENSERNITLLEKAMKLDPTNRYIKMKMLLLKPPLNQVDHIRALESLVKGGREDLWMMIYRRLEDAYYESGHKDKALKELYWFKKFAPDSWRNDARYFKVRKARYISLDEFKKDYLVNGDPNKKDIYGRKPIYYAIRSGQVMLFDWLVNNGLNKPLPNYALHQAEISKSPAMSQRVINIK